jgi:hypothetical protein
MLVQDSAWVGGKESAVDNEAHYAQNSGTSLMTQKPLTLEERVALLSDELALAGQWRRPSILLVVYRSALVRRAAQRLLAAHLQARGEQLHQIIVNTEQFDVLRALADQPISPATVYAISGLRHGGGKGGLNAYHALNLRREILVDRSLRATFWLTEAEARRLPREAPDFWAFRHHVVSLVDLRWK